MDSTSSMDLEQIETRVNFRMVMESSRKKNQEGRHPGHPARRATASARAWVGEDAGGNQRSLAPMC
jgi:hypothetical protein